MKFTVLYIDDQLQRLHTLALILESEGYDVLTADNGLDGIDLFVSRQVDIVILDYYMPSMDGGNVALQMRRLNPDVPIIIFSGALTLPDLVISMVDGFISTSEEPRTLLTKITELLPDRTQAQAS